MKAGTLLDRLESMNTQDIKLLFGELTAGELRTILAFMGWVIVELRKEQITRSDENK